MKNKMLLIVDPQIDFITGTLPVPGAEQAMNALASYIDEFGANYKVICVTCDRHSLRHCSFSEFGGQWPRHCVEASVGAAIWPRLMESLLQHSERVNILYKGENPEKDEYSIFQNTNGAEDIDKYIKDAEIEEIDICGLAGDVCVAATLSDAEHRYENAHFNLLSDYTAYIGI